jgi:CHAT domain-containing protein/Tfp pilus assembly protein PilF
MRRLGMGKTGPASLLLALMAGVVAWSAAAANSEGLVEQGRRAFEKGAFGEAASMWEKALETFQVERNTNSEIETSIELAAAYQSLGRQQRAVQLLENTLKKAESVGRNGQVADVKSKLGAALVMTRDTDRGGVLLREALDTANANRDPKLKATVLNDLGNFLSARQEYAEATSVYEEAIRLAQETSNSWLTAQALCNLAATTLRAGEFAKAEEVNSRAIREIGNLKPGHPHAFLLLSAAETDRGIRFSDAEAAKRVQLRAHGLLQEALEIAEKTKDRFVETYALGYLAEMYEADGQPDAALSLSRRAAFAAQEGQLPEALYRWEGLSGRLLKAQGNGASAISAYRNAVQTLQTIRNDVSIGYGNSPSYRSFRESEGPLFLGLADLLLEQSKGVSEPAQEQKLLVQARDVVEQLKSVELEAYFCDDCVDAQRSKTRAVEAVDKETAVIYLVSLPRRTEILVGLTSGMKRFTVEVGAEDLTGEVRQLRRNLETRTSYEYLAQAQQLYNWLIRPIRSFLRENGVTTLVFVPDGAIRTIPFATLHDGEHFLIQDLAVAVVPGLSMVDPKPIELSKARLLLNGLSDSVQGFAPLTFVTGELESIRKTYPSETLFNDGFTLSSLRHKLGDEQFSIVHIASHGQFDRDVRKTFVLTHDTKLTLNDLEAVIRPSQYRGRPVELLVLSACQTASGDDRAALGLAGVALKAGARSALATLWFVNDASTSELITEVYRQLQQSPRVSKAKALQAAQLKLLSDRRFRHPCYWSPYLIIGNWL